MRNLRFHFLFFALLPLAAQPPEPAPPPVPTTAALSTSTADPDKSSTADPPQQPSADAPQQTTNPQAQTGESQRVNPTPNPLEDARDRIWYPGDTESFKPLMYKLGGNILLDQKQIWTSPFHMHKADAPLWIGLGAATAALIVTDHRTSNALENSQGQIAWGNHLSNIGASYTVLPVIFGFYGFGVFDNDPKARETGILGTEALLDSMIVVGVLKEVALRNRPDATSEAGHFFEGGTSFPSGHAIQVWSVASVISYEYGHTKLVPIIADALAATVSVARFTARRHYASDILAGGAMGWFIGRYVWKTHQDHAIHPHSKLHAKIIPDLEPGSRTYAIGFQFGQ